MCRKLRELARRGLDRRCPALEQPRGVRGVEHHDRVDEVRHGSGLDVDPGHDPHVAARPAQRPEELGLLPGVHDTHPSVGRDDLGRDDVVDRQAVLAAHETDPARRGQPTDAHASGVARADREPVGREDLGDLTPGPARTQPHAAGAVVGHVDLIQGADVEDDSSVVGRAAADAVPGRTDRERDVLLAGPDDGLGHLVRGARTEHDPGRARAHVGVPHRVVRTVPGLDRALAQDRGERVVVDPRAPGREGRGAAAVSGGRRAGGPALGRDELAQRGRDLLAEDLDLARVVGREDEPRDAVLERERAELLDPLLGRTLEVAEPARGELAVDVEHAAHRARVAARGESGLVDHGVALGQVAGLEVGQRGQPAVTLAADEPLHAGLDRPDPQRDVVRRGGAALGAVDLVVRTVHAQGRPVARVPDASDDVDGLLERRDGLARREARRAHGLDGVPERACPQAHGEPAAREQVEARPGTGQHGRRAQRQVEDVARDLHALGRRGDPRHEGPGVEEGRLVGVVLEGHEVQARVLGELRETHGRLRVAVLRGVEGTEDEVVAVVRHACALRVPRERRSSPRSSELQTISPATHLLSRSFRCILGA